MSGEADNDSGEAPLTATVASSEAVKRSAGSDRLTEGDRLAGRYILTRYIATGGMGEVWEAKDVRLGEAVALKTIRPEAAHNADALKRFELEVKLARRVGHPNVCRVFDVGHHTNTDGTAVTFLTMELLVGTTLSDVIARKGPLKPEAALVVLKQVALGLDAAHAAGVVHRDLKCSNIFLQEAGGTERVVITDFGIARSLRDESRVTSEPGFLGTPAYMAPEQVEGGEVGPPADLFALGVVTFELLTRGFPFAGETPLENALARLTTPPRDLASMGVSVPEHWEKALARAMARKPADRFSSASDFVAALEGAPVQGRVISPASPRRKTAGLTVAIALAVAGLAVAAVRWLPGGEPGVTTPLTLANVPFSGSPPALAAQKFRDAMHAQAFGRFGRIGPLLDEALAVAPDFASASLQRAIYSYNCAAQLDEAGLGAFRSALARREQLSARERELFDAIAPSFGDPPRWDETERRATALVGQRPHDAQVLMVLAVAQIKQGRYDGALKTLDLETAIAPDESAAAAYAAPLHLDRGEVDRMQQRLTACIEKVPGSIDCRRWLLELMNDTGKCTEADRLVREMMGLAPEMRSVHALRVNAAAAVGAPNEALMQLMVKRRKLLPAEEQPAAAAGDEFTLAFRVGDFTEALAALQRQKDLLGDEATFESLHELASNEIDVLRESGDIRGAGEVAYRLLRSAAARATPEQPALDWTGPLLTSANLGGQLTSEL